MKLLVFGANGRQGSRVVTEALERGHEVTAVVHDAARADAVDTRAQVAVADARDAAAVAAVAGGHDAAINATRGEYVEIAQGLLTGLSQAGVKRLVTVGGAGSLLVENGERLVDQPYFPDVAKAEALAAAEGLDAYRAAETDVDWTFASPAALLDPGERTGSYRTGGDQLLTDDEGNSRISMEDFAIALVDEVEQGRHLKQRFTAAY